MKFTDEEIKRISLGAPAFLRSLEAREAAVLSRIHIEFRSGKTDFLKEITEYVVLREQIREFKTALTAYEKGDDL